MVEVLENIEGLESKDDNIEGDEKFIGELVKGLDKKELKELKTLAEKLMEGQEVHKSFYKVMYRNAFKYIACRRLYKKEIEAYTRKKILGDYICVATKRWVSLRR